MLITLIAIGAAHALYLAMLAFAQKEKGWPDYILATYLIVLAVMFGSTFVAAEFARPELMLFQLNINLLLAPLFFVYIQSVIQERRQNYRTLVLHFVPYMITWCYWLFLFALRSERDLDALFSGVETVQLPLLFRTALMLEFLAIPVYVCASLWILRKHKRAISRSLSFTEGIDLKWVYALVLCTGVIWLSMVLTEVVKGTERWITDDQTVQVGYASATFFVYYLGYFGLKQGHIASFVSVPDATESAPQALEEYEPRAKYLKSGLKEEEARSYAETLMNYVESEKPYLQSRLSIQDLARALGIPSYHLSQVINEHLGQSFYDFINRYRVDEFKRRIGNQQYRQYTLMSIALDCGFNSKSSFNRIFKKIEGCTPSGYVDGVKGG